MEFQVEARWEDGPSKPLMYMVAPGGMLVIQQLVVSVVARTKTAASKNVTVKETGGIKSVQELNDAVDDLVSNIEARTGCPKKKLQRAICMALSPLHKRLSGTESKP